MDSCSIRCPNCSGEIVLKVEKKISNTSIIEEAANLIIRFEGYVQKPYWDFKQWTNGYGTKAKDQFEIITIPEARKRLMDYIQQDYEQMLKVFKGTPPTQFIVALLSFSYNLGYGNALKMIEDFNNGKSFREIATRMKLYINAGGKPLQGLIDRREAETKLFLP